MDLSSITVMLISVSIALYFSSPEYVIGTVVFPAGKLVKTALAVPFTRGTASLPIVTVPVASSGNVTVTVTLSPSGASVGASMLIVAFCATVMFYALADNSLSNELTVTVAVLFSAFA